MIKGLFDILDRIRNDFHATFVEHWSSLAISGTYTNGNTTLFNTLSDYFITHDLQSSLTYFIGVNSCPISDFLDDIQENDTWRITINKEVLIREEREGAHSNFFYNRDDFFLWGSKANPFDEDHPFNIYSPIRIIVKDIGCNFGGPNIFIHNQQECVVSFGGYDHPLPTHQDIMDIIHVVAEKPFCIHVDRHLITFGEPERLIPNDFLKNSAKILLCCLVHEVQKDEKVILRGVRRLDMLLCGDGDVSVSLAFNNELLDAVRWVYGENERRDLRLKLLLERITLDIDLSKSLLVGLPYVLANSLQQAKERYSFIVYERNDSYQKELKDLLKDLKSLTDLYSNKVRSLLSNLLRDVLAAFILVGITLFSKTEEIARLWDNELIRYVFMAFGCYFVISAAFQSITDFYDIRRSEKEFDYWKNVSRAYMTREDFKAHKSNTLKKRATGTTTIYVFILLCYFAIASVCFNFPCIWNKIMN